MSSYKVLFFGKSGSGKTQLVNKIIGKSFDDKYLQTTNAYCEYTHISGQQIELKLFQLWDTARIDQDSSSPIFNKPNILIYCIDTSGEISINDVEIELEKYIKRYAKASIILVGTKNDGDEVAFDLSQINVTKPIDRVLISVKTNYGIQKLNETIERICEIPERILYVSDLGSHLATLKKQLPARVFEKIGAELTRLDNVITVVSRGKQWINIDKVVVKSVGISKIEEAIVDFQINSQRLIVGSYPRLMNTIYAITACIVATVLVTLLGFGIGFAAGAWLGPGAFITGVVAGSAATVAVVTSSAIVGVGTGAFVGYRLFQRPKEFDCLNEFSQSVSDSLENFSRR